MTIREALNIAQSVLLAAGVEEAKLDAEYLLAEVLDAPRLLVCVSGETPLPPVREQLFFELIERRAAREPLQYILKTQDFMGLTFSVTPDVLIPRADTETLCEQALLRLSEGAFALDLCTGSGALAISMKALSPSCTVIGTDISAAALQIARKNAADNGADVTFLQGDLWDAVGETRFDVIVSNPPYIPSKDLKTLQQEVQKEPALALDGGEDGLDFYRRIALGAPAHLKSGGWLLLEIGDSQGDAVSALLSSQFEDVSVIHDLSGRPRVVSARLRGKTA